MVNARHALLLLLLAALAAAQDDGSAQYPALQTTVRDPRADAGAPP